MILAPVNLVSAWRQDKDTKVLWLTQIGTYQSFTVKGGVHDSL